MHGVRSSETRGHVPDHGSCLYRPDHLPPSQGGKYVGFGSSPAPQPSSRGGGGAALGTVNVDDVTHMLSKGLTSLTHVSRLLHSTKCLTHM
jgi:hypothetical protein